MEGPLLPFTVLRTANAQITTCWTSISAALLKMQCAHCNFHLKVTCILPLTLTFPQLNWKSVVTGFVQGMSLFCL